MISTTDPAMLTKAVLRAAERLGLSRELPDILGIDANEWSAMVSRGSTLDPTSESWQAATTFAHMFRALVSLVGSIDDARTWFDDATSNTWRRACIDVAHSRRPRACGPLSRCGREI